MAYDLETPPASPSPKTASTGWGAPPESGMGPEASNPQVKALQGVKMIEMGAQQISAAIPELAGPIQAFVQQLTTLVPQVMSQNMATGGAPSPVPTM